MEAAIIRTKDFVEKHMSGFDSSHDFDHVLRVVNTALHIAEEEEAKAIKSKRTKEEGIMIKYDKQLIILAALLHDVWDRKYLPDDFNGESEITKTLSEILGLPLDMTTKVNDIISHVSYTTEVKDLSAVEDAIKRNPELACVQDADRLDALGAIGVGRAFTYNAVRVERVKAGAKNLGNVPEGYNCMVAAIEHYDVKLFKLETMMKTNTGREIARVKTERLRTFQRWWEEEFAVPKEAMEDQLSKHSLSLSK